MTRPLGPNRLAALQESRPGQCAMCDERPIKEPRRSIGRGGKYTCGRPECIAAWGYACQLDQLERKRRAA